MTLATRETDTLQLAAQSMQLFGFGKMLINSGMLPSSIKRPEAAVALMVKGMELGLPPMAAINGISVIQGKPTVSPQLMLSLINRSGQLEDIDIKTGTDGASVTMKRKGRSAHTATFGPAEAKAMQLDTKDNYRKQAPVMYQWRAVAACARVVFPDVIDGLYTPEEMGAEVQVNEDGEMTFSVQQEPKPDPEILKQWQSKLDKLVHAAKTRTAAPHDKVDLIVAAVNGSNRNGDVAGLKVACDEITALGKAHPLKPTEVDAELTPEPKTIGKEAGAKIHKYLGAMLKDTEYEGDNYAFASDMLGKEVKSFSALTPEDEIKLGKAAKEFEAGKVAADKEGAA